MGRAWASAGCAEPRCALGRQLRAAGVPSPRCWPHDRQAPPGPAVSSRLPTLPVVVLTEQRGGWGRLQGGEGQQSGSAQTEGRRVSERRQAAWRSRSARAPRPICGAARALHPPARTAEPAKALQGSGMGGRQRLRCGASGWGPLLAATAAGWLHCARPASPRRAAGLRARPPPRHRPPRSLLRNSLHGDECGGCWRGRGGAGRRDGGREAASRR